MAIKLNELPNEVIYQILLHLPPASAPKVQQVSRQFNDLAQPILWRSHCRTCFKYWSPEHEIQQKFSGIVAKVDWKKVFLERHNADRATTLHLNSIISSQTNRISKTTNIVALGYDVKDTLLRHLHVGDEAEDVLARWYYSDAVLSNLHRRMAIKDWVTLKEGGTVALERALVAFDMFVLHGRKGDPNEVSALLDKIAGEFRNAVENFEERSPRSKAIALCEYLRERNLVGINGDARYHDLRHNFIGIALQEQRHQSLPIVSVVIFCCVATRLGIDAQPCGFPFHVLAIIKPHPGQTMEGRSTPTTAISSPMYVDPFRSSSETSVDHLKTQLQSLGVPPSHHSTLLDASTTEEMVRRCAKNIIASVQALPPQNAATPLSAHVSFPETEGALYAALWSLILLPEGDQDAVAVQRTRYLGFIVERMASQYPIDAGLVEEYILPLITNPGHREHLMETIRAIHIQDQTPKKVKGRSTDLGNNVQYKVGRVFCHKRYHYQAIITGWDAKCEAEEDWKTTMGISTLRQGEHQGFYNVLVDDRSVRYVAEENIDLLEQDVPEPKLMALAGQHFKRWDKAAKVFVSNIKDEYPDD